MNLLRFIPAGIGPRLAVLGLAFVIGLRLGNHWATERAIEREQRASVAALEREKQASADRQRENHKQLLAWTKDVERKLKTDAAQKQAADKAAYDVLASGKASSDRALARARSELKTLEVVQQNKLAEVRNDLASQGPSDPGCVLSSGVRNALNSAIASINAHPTIGDTEGQGPRILNGPDTSDTVLTCDELAASVIDILEHDAMLTAWILSFQAWEVEISR